MVLFSERIDLTINIRTFESSSLFVTLPPGISISQILDNHEYYQMQEAYTSIDTRHSVSSSSTPYAGLKSQHVNTMPFSKTVNGNGMSNLPHHLTRPRCAPSSHHAGPVYCPPAKAPQDRRQKATGNDSDVDMVPMRTNKSHKPNSAAHRSPPIHTQSQDALDPQKITHHRLHLTYKALPMNQLTVLSSPVHPLRTVLLPTWETRDWRTNTSMTRMTLLPTWETHDWPLPYRPKHM